MVQTKASAKSDNQGEEKQAKRFCAVLYQSAYILPIIDKK